MKSRRSFPFIHWSSAASVALCLALTSRAADPAPAAPPSEPAKPETPAGDATKTDAPKAEATKAEDAKAEEAKSEEAKSEESKPETLTPEQIFEGGSKPYNNWIELGGGGFITSGSDAQFQQRHRTSNNAFGGIEDLHYQDEVAKGTTFTLDGQGIFDNNDYKLSLGINKEKLGYARVTFSQYRTWYNADGGYFTPNDRFYAHGNDAVALDRGDLTFEAGLRLEKYPKITFKYSHTYREGDKSSTIWGATHPTGDIFSRNLAPSFYNLDEVVDTFQLDATHKIKATDFGVGVRYETGKLDNSLNIIQWPNELTQSKITDKQGTSYDLFNVHAFTETWLKKNLVVSSGFSYSDLDNDFSGSRIYGSDFDVNYVPGAQNGYGYYGLNGGSRMHEYVADLNLMYKPSPNLAVTPSIRVQKEDTDASTSAFETLASYAPTPFASESDSGLLDVRERLDLRYSGITNWVLYARGEWTQGDGNLNETGGLIRINNIGVPSIYRETDDSRFFQKYSAGARWYPSRTVSVDAGGYYKINNYDYDHNVDSTPNNGFNRYPAYLVTQDFETYDGNGRLTLRPWRNVSMVSRYEYQISTIHTQPDSISGLADVETSEMTSHIIGEDITWVPWSRLSLQVGFSYVLSKTETPTSQYTQAVLDARNNYWTVNASSTFVLDEKTDFNLGYFYYQAADYSDNSESGVAYGAGGFEHNVTAGIVRRISPQVRLNLKYGFFHYDDETSGHNNDFESHMVYSSLQYRF